MVHETLMMIVWCSPFSEVVSGESISGSDYTCTSAELAGKIMSYPHNSWIHCKEPGTPKKTSEFNGLCPNLCPTELIKLMIRKSLSLASLMKKRIEP